MKLCKERCNCGGTINYHPGDEPWNCEHWICSECCGTWVFEEFDYEEVDMSEQVTCPVCNGTGRRPIAADSKWHTSIAGYDKDTHTLPCTNCGGQTMSCNGTGKVNARPDGTPCVHEYEYESLGRCYHGYTCKHCGDRYTIDSGD